MSSCSKPKSTLSKATESDEDQDSYSDEFDSQDDNDAKDDVPSTPPTKKRKATVKARTPVTSPGEQGLSLTKSKQLAADVIQNGGLENFSLRIVTEAYKVRFHNDPDNNPYALATPNSSKQRQLQNKINYWKGKGRHQFNNFAVGSPQPAKQPPGPHQPSIPPSVPAPFPSVGASTAARSVKSPQLTKYVRPFDPEAPTLIMDDTIRNNSAKARVINVNLELPEKNGPCIISKFNNYNADNVLFDGFILQLQDVDHRFVMMEEECVQAHLVAPNEILVKLPSTCYSYLHDINEETKAKENANFDDEVFKNSTETTRTAIAGNTNRHFSYVRYIFPKALNNDVFTKDYDLYLKKTHECDKEKAKIFAYILSQCDETMKTGKCFKCGTKGHKQADCPEIENDDDANGHGREEEQNNMEVGWDGEEIGTG